MMPAIYGNSYQIVQGPGYVAIRYEMVHETRIIPLDRRDHVSNKLPLDMGDARAHFEGDTLVIETTNFRERSAFGGASSHLKTTERFRPARPGVIEWSMTFDDPHTWVRPWTFGMQLTRNDAEPVLSTPATRATRASKASWARPAPQNARKRSRTKACVAKLNPRVVQAFRPARHGGAEAPHYVETTSLPLREDVQLVPRLHEQVSRDSSAICRNLSMLTPIIFPPRFRILPPMMTVSMFRESAASTTVPSA